MKIVIYKGEVRALPRYRSLEPTILTGRYTDECRPCTLPVAEFSPGQGVLLLTEGLHDGTLLLTLNLVNGVLLTAEEQFPNHSIVGLFIDSHYPDNLTQDDLVLLYLQKPSS